MAGTVGAASCLLSGCWECWPAPQPPACSREGFRAHPSPAAQAGSRVRGVAQREMRKRWGPYRTAQWEVSKNMRTLNTGLEAPFQPALLFLEPCLPRGPERWRGRGGGKSSYWSSVCQAHSSSAPGLPGEGCLGVKNTSRDAWEQARSPLVALFCGSGWEGIRAHALSQEGQALRCLGEAEIKLGICSRGWALSCVEYLPSKLLSPTSSPQTVPPSSPPPKQSPQAPILPNNPSTAPAPTRAFDVPQCPGRALRWSYPFSRGGLRLRLRLCPPQGTCGLTGHWSPCPQFLLDQGFSESEQDSDLQH